MNTQHWRLNDKDYIDDSAFYMVLIQKLSSFTFNVADGKKKSESLDEFQKRNAIKAFPSILEYLGWCFCFVGSFVGPGVHFAHYKTFIESRVF